jgi:hypothetical protein
LQDALTGTLQDNLQVSPTGALQDNLQDALTGTLQDNLQVSPTGALQDNLQVSPTGTLHNLQVSHKGTCTLSELAIPAGIANPLSTRSTNHDFDGALSFGADLLYEPFHTDISADFSHTECPTKAIPKIDLLPSTITSFEGSLEDIFTDIDFGTSLGVSSSHNLQPQTLDPFKPVFPTRMEQSFDLSPFVVPKTDVQNGVLANRENASINGTMTRVLAFLPTEMDKAPVNFESHLTRSESQATDMLDSNSNRQTSTPEAIPKSDLPVNLPASTLSVQRVIDCTWPTCYKTFNSRASYKYFPLSSTSPHYHLVTDNFSHHTRYHTLPHRCLHCISGFATKKELDRHVNSRHDRTEKFYCLVATCKRSLNGGSHFSREDNCKRHMKTKHNVTDGNVVRG